MGSSITTSETISTSISSEYRLESQVFALGEQQQDSKTSKALQDSSSIYDALESAQRTCLPQTPDCMSKSLACSDEDADRLRFAPNSEIADCKALPSQKRPAVE